MSTLFVVRVTKKPNPCEISFEIKQSHPDASIPCAGAHQFGLRVLFLSAPYGEAPHFYTEDDPVFDWLEDESWLDANAPRFIEVAELEFVRPLRSADDHRAVLIAQGLNEDSNEFFDALDDLLHAQEHNGLLNPARRF